MMKRVCMLSQAQPSTNPRLVKEADTLEESGFRVEVLCTSHVAWAADADRELLAGRSWRCTILGADAHPAHTQWSRLIHRAARTIEPALHPAAVSQACAHT